MNTERGETLRKSHSVARCAKSAMLLLSLKQSPGLNCLKTKSSYHKVQQENELMKRTIEDLRISLAIERMKRREVKLVDLLVLILQIALLLAIWSIFLVMASNFL